MLKKLLLAVLVAAPMLVSAQTVKLGAVNPTEIMNVMPEMATAQNTLKTASDKYTAQGKTLQEEYQKKLTEYDNLTKSKAAEATLEAKAKEISGLADQLITLAKRGDLAARRQAIAQLADEDVVRKLFTDIVEYDSVKNRQGGYTRTLKLGVRRGDAAPMVILELVK